MRKKEHYVNPAIELIVELDDKVVGLIDIECEAVDGSIARIQKARYSIVAAE